MTTLLIPITQATQLVPRPILSPQKAGRQLDLAFDRVDVQAMTPADRQVVLRSLVRLLLEAGGISREESGDDHA